jgi:hypothetical protein
MFPDLALADVAVEMMTDPVAPSLEPPEDRNTSPLPCPAVPDRSTSEPLFWLAEEPLVTSTEPPMASPEVPAACFVDGIIIGFSLNVKGFLKNVGRIWNVFRKHLFGGKYSLFKINKLQL